MLPRPVVVALVALLVGTAVAPAAAADDCFHPFAAGARTCDDDKDGRTDTVRVTVDEDGQGSLEVVAQDYSASDGTHRGGHAQVATEEGSPVGAHQVAVHGGCGADVGLVPCTDAGLGAEAGGDQADVAAGADCDKAVVVGPTPACDLATASAGAGYGGQTVDAGARCGNVGGLSPCPVYLRGSLEASTLAGDLGIYAGGTPLDASACEVDAHTDTTCVTLP